MTQISRTVRGAAQATTLLSDITAAVPGAGGQLAVQLAAQWPGSNFVAIIDRLGANPEKILCSSRVGNTLLVSQRGYDGTGTGQRTVEAYKNGTVGVGLTQEQNPGAVPTADLSVSFQVPGLVAGDYIEIHVVQSSGGNLNTGTPTHFSGHWVRP